MNTTRIMFSKYAGMCGRCGKKFAVGERISYDFQLRSSFCLTCPHTVQSQTLNNLSFSSQLLHGYYTIPSGRTFRIHTPKVGTYKNRTMLQLQDTSTEIFHNVAFYDGNVFSVFRKFSHDTQLLHAIRVLCIPGMDTAYGMNYATHSKRCYRCGRKLTNTTSVAQQAARVGMGPCCYKLSQIGAESSSSVSQRVWRF